jgi:small subunit ribosomal protein S6
MSQTTKTYEGMFLLPAGLGDFEAAIAPVRTVLERGEAEVLSLKPWDERRLAYEIGGNRRGMYVLTYFKADPEKISEIEQDCQLNETILRVLILRRDVLTKEQLEDATPATRRMAAAEKAKEEAPTPPPEPATDNTPAAEPASAEAAAKAPAAEPASDEAAAKTPAAEPAKPVEAAEPATEAPEADKPAAAPEQGEAPGAAAAGA